jgi:hypothetical protein
LIVASQSDEGTDSQTVREEDLRHGINPNLLMGMETTSNSTVWLEEWNKIKNSKNNLPPGLEALTNPESGRKRYLRRRRVE